MPRHSRQKSTTNVYHVVVKGADRQLLFEEPKDYIKYLCLLEYYMQECNFELYAYCLMSNHVHLLIHHSDTFSLSAIFRKLNTAYAQWFNMKYNRTGFVQNDRFYSEPVEDQTYLMTVIRYIHWNPAKAGLEPIPGTDYRWSSYNDYEMDSNKRDSSLFVNTQYILNLFGGIESFKKYHTSGPNEQCLDINQFRTRIPDDVAEQIIQNISNCSTVTDFQKLSLLDRNKYIPLIHKEGVSIRQINRLTGTPRGIIERIIQKNCKSQT